MIIFGSFSVYPDDVWNPTEMNELEIMAYIEGLI